MCVGASVNLLFIHARLCGLTTQWFHALCSVATSVYLVFRFSPVRPGKPLQAGSHVSAHHHPPSRTSLLSDPMRFSVSSGAFPVPALGSADCPWSTGPVPWEAGGEAAAPSPSGHPQALHDEPFPGSPHPPEQGRCHRGPPGAATESSVLFSFFVEFFKTRLSILRQINPRLLLYQTVSCCSAW